jgi:hypothetical protein
MAACGFGCSSARPIVAADAGELRTVRTAQVAGNGLALSAAVLGEDQAERLLGVDVSGRSVLPVLFAVKNEAATSYLLLREHFSLNINGRL